MVKTSKVKLDIKRLVPTVLQSFFSGSLCSRYLYKLWGPPKVQDYYIIICCLLTVASKPWAKKRINLFKIIFSSHKGFFLHFRLLLKSLG